MKIPITMCHGINVKVQPPLAADHFDRLIRIASEMGFQSITYDELWDWREGSGRLPTRPIMFDFDHPVKSMRYEIHEVLSRYGYRGNLFVNTGVLDHMYSAGLPAIDEQEFMTWEEIAELADDGWLIGAHTVTHPNLSELSLQDPTGELLRFELARCDEALEEHVGVRPKDFAFVGTSWSSIAEKEVAKRYRFGRLWIRGPQYQADGKTIRYADLVGVPGPDEPDGGPPAAARYIKKDTHPYRLPSMEIQADLIYEPDAFRRYLEGSLEN